jgi:molybdopterin biosynthesis enzyme
MARAMAENNEQRISKLTSLTDALARIDAAVKPVAAQQFALREAHGRVLAADAVQKSGLPPAPLALRDGYAVRSDTTTDASSYAPAPLAAAPARVDAGNPLPSGTDAVASPDAIVVRNGRYEIIAPVAPGEGVLAANTDAAAGTPLRRAGERVRDLDLAVLNAAGIANVMVREPNIFLVTARPQGDRFIDGAREWIAPAIGTGGGFLVSFEGGPVLSFEAALKEDEADAIVAIGGTGFGRSDAGVRTLARVGKVEFHGVALAPGETVAFGTVDRRPVLLLPGRIDAAMAAWLMLGRRMLARLTGSAEELPGTPARLMRKVSSALGTGELVAVRMKDGKAEPIASGYVPLHALAHSDGWIFVPAASEGYPADAEVVVHPWP